MEINEITREIIGGAMEVHSALGPGLLESTYRACLRHELTLRGITHHEEVDLPITYKGLTIAIGYRVDLIVCDKVIVELKAVSKTLPVHESQLLSYLRMSNRPVGLLINFHVQHLRDGIKRMANGFSG